MTTFVDLAMIEWLVFLRLRETDYGQGFLKYLGTKKMHPPISDAGGKVCHPCLSVLI